jgi:hypothetical protein
MSEKLGIKEILFLGVIPINSIKPIFATFLPKKTQFRTALTDSLL